MAIVVLRPAEWQASRAADFFPAGGAVNSGPSSWMWTSLPAASAHPPASSLLKKGTGSE